MVRQCACAISGTAANQVWSPNQFHSHTQERLKIKTDLKTDVKAQVAQAHNLNIYIAARPKDTYLLS